MARGANAAVGAERISQNGYLYVKTEDGWKLAHRLMAEREILKRPLNPNERVTFRNGNKLDVRVENLKVSSVRTDMHTMEKRRDALIVRIEELQGQLADLEEAIAKQQVRS
jgi:hypothetical protein